MSNLQFSFPPSRTCLWDVTPTGSSCELHITRNSWLCVRISSATLQLAVRHAKQSHRKLFECFLISTAWITEGESIALEVDRFDPGRPSSSGSGLSPTTLIPGDLPIPSQITIKPHPEAKYLTHNMETLRQAVALVKQSLSSHTTPLDPALSFSLRIHCTCSEDGQLDVECACVYPGLVIEAVPIKPISIVQTALARNLSGPLSLSVIQGKTKHGYVTMEASRKLVLLLHSDPKATELPLVGVWVSGVSSVYHPTVWMACVRYTHSTTLTDRVWGEGESFVALVYLEGSTKPLLVQCTMKDCDKTARSVEMASGESSLPASSTVPLLSFKLYPVQESTALHTLLETVVGSSRSSDRCGGKMSCDLVPLPSPQPTPTQVPPKLTRDSELSMVSCLSLSDDGHASHSLTSPVTGKSRDSPRRSPAQLEEDKENTLINDQPFANDKGKEATPTNQSLMSRSLNESPLHSVCEAQTDDSLVVFPDKVGVGITPRSAGTRRMLKQQEMQLKALQEQVNTLLQAQSQSPVSLSVNTTPKVEASTSTGESLCWPQPSSHPPSSHSSPFTLSQPRNFPTPSTPAQPHNFSSQSHTNVEREGSSVYSSIVSALSVQTSTSTLSHSSSDMNLDLQSYAQSLSPPQSPSFGESASLVAKGNSPASLLSSDQQHQLYQNMLSTVNALLSSQDNSSPDSNSCLGAPSSPDSDTLSYHSNISQNSEHSPDLTHSTKRQPESQTSQHSSYHHSTQEQGTHTSNSTTNESRSPHNILNVLPPNELSGPAELPYLHPDVLQQQLSAEVSLIPVPRIVAPISSASSHGYDESTIDMALYPRGYPSLAGSNCTLDENMQMADMITKKYLSSKLAPNSNVHHVARQTLIAQGTDSILDTGSAHMSMATRQYLQRHHLMASNGSKAPDNTTCKEDSPPQDTHDNILNIRRLKELPKLI